VVDLLARFRLVGHRHGKREGPPMMIQIIIIITMMPEEEEEEKMMTIPEEHRSRMHRPCRMICNAVSVYEKSNNKNRNIILSKILLPLPA